MWAAKKQVEKGEVHASESGAAATGGTARAMALEQLIVLIATLQHESLLVAQ